MSKDWFDYLVGTAQILTGVGVLFAFLQVRVTQAQLNVTQAQLEEERKNSKPEIFIAANTELANNGETDYIEIVAINVKNIPIYVKNYLLELETNEGDTLLLDRSILESEFGFLSHGLTVLSIGNSSRISIPETFFTRPFKDEYEYHFIDKSIWQNAERVDIVFKIPGISPDPRISFTLEQIENPVETVLLLKQIHNDKSELIARWEIERKPQS